MTNCGTERISRMEKAFYPRNDTVNATISNLLPRDGTEDILPDQSGDPIYLQRSSILDGTEVRGFGYVDSHPYKWRAEIETAVKSIAIVPDRFFSIYGKSYPIKRKQTVGINQPSESFKYEIIYLRGYDKYDDEKPIAKIIYHRQMEQNISHEYVCEDDREALQLLDNVAEYPFLKIRVCYDGTVKAYLGSQTVDWDLERQVEDAHAAADTKWVEIPQINVSQFEGIDLWLRFESINALSYYLLTKYENDIYNIAPKNISSVLEAETVYGVTVASDDDTVYLNGKIKTGSAPDAARKLMVWTKSENGTTVEETTVPSEGLNVHVNIPRGTTFSMKADSVAEASLYLLKERQGGNIQIWIDSVGGPSGSVTYTGINAFEAIKGGFTFETTGDTILSEWATNNLHPAGVVGYDYDLENPGWESDNTGCIPCCKKDNLSRAIWAYVNPKTMTPYDDDYWFHQGEPYYKKSLTLSTKERPLKAKKIFVEAGVFPGMYKIVGETYIRSRDTGEDERVQLSFPLCKVKSNQTLTLSADGDPTTFSLEVEVATPENGIPMEITFYEVEKDQKIGCSGSLVEKDGSTKISAK